MKNITCRTSATFCANPIHNPWQGTSIEASKALVTAVTQASMDVSETVKPATPTRFVKDGFRRASACFSW